MTKSKYTRRRPGRKEWKPYVRGTGKWARKLAIMQRRVILQEAIERDADPWDIWYLQKEGG